MVVRPDEYTHVLSFVDDDCFFGEAGGAIHYVRVFTR
jgi:hypothetical protein